MSKINFVQCDRKQLVFSRIEISNMVIATNGIKYKIFSSTQNNNVFFQNYKLKANFSDRTYVVMD